ncbi:MAG: hypothetical protein CML83_01335 [Rhodobiaceae bacterium]|nr:hypothetical protein [Rhodobiaceae bacterium]OUT75416.1 MAG: hypothetical protein CBB85_01055 [Rhizobiales bacterium TMED25]
MRRSPNTNILFTLLRNVARVYIRDFGELQNLQNTNRSVHDFVQKSKKRVESLILEELMEKYSNQNYEFFSINGEQKIIQKDIDDSDNCFIINALDGELNYKRTIPLFCISIAHKRNGVIENSIVYNPITDDIFIGENGIGATHNNIKMQVSSEQKIEYCLFGIDNVYEFYENFNNNNLNKLLAASTGIRSFGAISLSICMVGSGKLNVFINRLIQPHEIDASLLILKEAAGKYNYLKNPEVAKPNYFIVSNEKIYDNLSSILI